VTRRQFGIAAAAAASAASTPTAREVVERIQKNAGVPWRSSTSDTFKAGDPETPVTGIATTFMATLDVLRRAAAGQHNLVITHEPTFYNHLDATKPYAEDAVYKHKRAFIDSNRMVVWRFHDHWRVRKPDAGLVALAELLGWEKYQSADDAHIFVLPVTTLEKLAKEMRKRLGVRTLRATGDPKARVSRISLYPGLTAPQVAAKVNPDYDVYVGGETVETDGGAYAQDMIAAGIRKGMILLGHEVSEDPAMRRCADWLKGLVPEVPVTWLPSGEPFW
jgi:putative NIF3 family GTP cyclohydrolase 1 type 2